jgi:arginyl-tRNA synthetase
MHVGHIRSTILGDSLARIAEFSGHRVVRDNHIGDWGTQFGMLLVGWKSELDEQALEADALGEMERIYKLISARCKADPAVLEKARQELVKLQSGDEENLAIWKNMIRLSQTQFDAVYGRLKAVVQELLAAGIARESEGAICVFSDGSLSHEQDPFFIKDKETKEWRPNPAIIQKNDGAANYTTSDLATLAYRMATWNPDEIVYVTDGRQQHHFKQLFSIFRRWKPEAQARLAHVWFGSILGEDGKPFKTRSGETIKLVELLDEAVERALKIVTEKNPEMPEGDRREIARVIGLGAVKYADLLPNRQSDYVFSWDKMLSLQGNTAPYLQNAFVRVRSIFRKAQESGGAPFSGSFDPEVLQEPAELELIKKLNQFGEVLPVTLDDFRPNLLCNYLFETAAQFHGFFEACPVLRAESEALRNARLALCDATGRILKKGLELLGIEAPERM